MYYLPKPFLSNCFFVSASVNKLASAATVSMAKSLLLFYVIVLGGGGGASISRNSVVVF
jgi:hypothetical protein